MPGRHPREAAREPQQARTDKIRNRKRPTNEHVTHPLRGCQSIYLAGGRGRGGITPGRMKWD